MIKTTISDEEINALPIEVFEGEMVMVEDETAMAEMVEELLEHDTIGFDTETRPAFTKGVTYKIALLQLAIPNKVFLIRVHKVGISHDLGRIFQNKNIVKAGVAIHDDIKGMRKFNDFTPLGFVDLQDMSKQKGLEVFSLKKMAALLMNVRISKRQRLTNWEADELTLPQKVYAATDAYVSLELYHKLKVLEAIPPVKKEEI